MAQGAANRMTSDHNGKDIRVGYQLERLDSVADRLSHIEGEMKHLATKEDVSNAKLQLYLSWGAVVATGIIAAATAIARFWPD